MNTKKIKPPRLLLIIVLLLAAILRFWGLSNYPAGVNADEASYAYNAYSLILTGKDEHGIGWPIHLKSFADYKPAGTAYVLVPFVKLFGLNEWSLRIPSALAGVISVLLIYLLVKELFGEALLAMLAALFLEISPWHIHFSRGEWETNLATTGMIAGFWLFFKALKEPRHFWLVPFPLAFSLYTYHSPRVIIPLLLFLLLIFYRRVIFKFWRQVTIGIVIGVFLLFPLALDFFGPAVAARFSGVGLLADIGPGWRATVSRNEHQNPNSLGVRLLHNRPLNYLLEFGQNYFDHFEGNFLFILGDRIKRSNSPDMGEMYLFDAVFLLAGIYFLLKNKPLNWHFPFLWLLASPIPAALTFQTPNALRAHNMVIPLIIISSYGFYCLVTFIKRKGKKWLFILSSLLFTFILIWNFAYFLQQYFVRYPRAYPEAWEYGFRELVPYLDQNKDKYEKIYVTERYDQPYIIFLFYLKYPPEIFQKEVILTQRDKFGFSTVRDFGKFHFENINWEKLKDKRNVLIVGTDEEIPDSAKIIKEIDFLNGQPAFQIAKL